jgi:predicted O-methyltransferase YrrM
MMSQLPAVLIDMYATGFVLDRNNEKRFATNSTISEAEALILMKAVTDSKASVTLETGVAFGASCVAICYAKKDFVAGKKIHYGVDPNQSTEYANAAIVSLEKEKLQNDFEILEGPSHLMLPRLIKENVKLDFAFVDGWHTFDYTLIDFFLIDKMLRPGGMVAFHDMHSLSKQKVLRYILTHRKYKVMKEYKVKGNESRMSTIKFFLWRLFRKPQLLFSWFHWNYQLYNSSGLIVLKKEESFEPDYTFYKRF